MFLFNIVKINPFDLFLVYLAILCLFFSIIDFFLRKLLTEIKILPKEYFNEKKYLLRIVLFFVVIVLYCLKILAEILPEDYFEEDFEEDLKSVAEILSKDFFEE